VPGHRPVLRHEHLPALPFMRRLRVRLRERELRLSRDGL
jgi:hypothetical protein